VSRAVELAGPWGRVHFAPNGDCFAQRIELLRAVSNPALGASQTPTLLALERSVPSVMSEEAATTAEAVQQHEELTREMDRWPLSPPLQEVHLEERPGGEKLSLMVGRAGRSHWSVSCELQSESGNLAFDVACRIKEPAPWLGSSYQLSPGLVYEGDQRSGELRFHGAPLCVFETTDQEHLAWDSKLGILTIRPESRPDDAYSDPSGTFPRTIRWRYRLKFEI